MAIFAGEMFSRVATLLMALIVARRFGPASLGQYGFAVALASVLLIIPDFGLHLLTTRTLANEPERLRRTFWTLHWLKLTLVVTVAAFTALFGESFVQDSGRRCLLFVLAARALFQTFSQAYMAIFKAFERMHYIAMQQLVNSSLTIACAGIALAVRASLPVVVGCLLVGEVGEAWLGWQIVHRRFAPGSIYGWDSAYLREMMVAAAPIGITAILQALNLRLDVLTLGVFATNAELGRFQAAAWFLVGTYLCTSLLMSVIFPKLCRLLRNPTSKASAYLESLLKHGTLLVTLASLATWFGAPHILRWSYGTKLSDAMGLLRILAPALPFMFMNTTLFYVFVAAQRRTVYLGTLGLGVGLGAALGLFLARRYGASGAALADLIREFFVAAVFLCHLKREHLAPSTGLGFLKVCAAAACLTLLLGAIAGHIGSWLEWSATWNVLMLAGTLIFVGFPRRQELFLLVDENG